MLELIVVIVVIYLLYLAVKWLVQTYVGAIGTYYNTLLGPLVLVITVITAIIVLISFIRAYYICFSRKDPSYDPQPDTKEPAFKSYFFHQGFLDYKTIVKLAWKFSVEAIFRWGWKLFLKQLGITVIGWIFLPFTLPLYLALLAGVIISVVPFLLLSLVHTAILLFALICVVLSALFLNIVEKISMLWRSLNYVCPHTGCYQRVALPIYVCPACGAWHHKLLPGKYGVFRRKCKCGKLIPTSPLTGRNRLDMICPNTLCNKPLHKSIGSAPSYHFAVLGEPSSGKTSYLYALIFAMLDIKKLNWFSINNDSSKKIYEVFRQEYNRGIPPLKTVQKLPDSLILKSNPEVGNGLFYFYDPAGEYFLSDADTINRGSYQEYLDGLFFIIDPFSLPSIRAKCSQEELEQAGAASGDYLKVYERLINYMRSTYNEKLLRKVPVSVIITKCDLIHSNSKFRSPIFSYTDEQLSGWLAQNGLETIMNAFNVHFQPELVRFFAVSSFGSAPSVNSGKAFSPVNVINPYSWLLTNNSLNPDTGSVPVLKMKSEFVGNSLGFVTASTLFFLSFSLLYNPVSNLAQTASKAIHLSFPYNTEWNTFWGNIKSNMAEKNLVFQTNPNHDVFFEQDDLVLTVSRTSTFTLEGNMTYDHNNQIMSDKFMIIGENDSLVYDSRYINYLEQVKKVQNTYKISGEFQLAPGQYRIYFLPAVYRRNVDINSSAKFRAKHKIWQVKLLTTAQPGDFYAEYQVLELHEAAALANGHWSIKNQLNKGYEIRRSFFRDKPGRRPVLYLLLVNPEDNSCKTAIVTLANNRQSIRKVLLTIGDSFDFEW